MTRVSSQPVPKATLEKISELLIHELARIRTKSGARHMFESFFTKAEKVMLAKRFAILVLRAQGVPYSTIGKKLKVSPSTIGKLEARRLEGEFDELLRRVCPPPRGRQSRASAEMGSLLAGFSALTTHRTVGSVFRAMDGKRV